MEGLQHFRQLYQPVQPAAEQEKGPVLYRELLPHAGLLAYVYCYWELKSTGALAVPYHYRVIADGCIDIYFEPHQPTESYLMGFSNSYTAFPLYEDFHFVGIRFLPGMLPLLFRLNAAELTDQSAPLDAICRPLATFLAARFHPGLALGEMKALLDEYLLGLVGKGIVTADSRLYEAISTILDTGGMIGIEKELAVGISPRQLRRLFQFYVGDTPKAFSEVIRFQKTLQRMTRHRKQRAYLDTGYYDQAHFIKSFKQLYGLTPSKVLL
ncbi:helix-turn-helix protein [Chitinophaga polysaccharea]|uniref:Helix-turn-helix protein n=1 Tax=Chitinophaga polysaccharea TaxID=1293035 RepID=A0A561P797_9BACT|nr:helix-turn-helix domain-containing protein [Chitinophaga polysaccharea]TWF33971.1 helix-turn-helix protein [Chitinophaga polysaccharea]